MLTPPLPQFKIPERASGDKDQCRMHNKSTILSTGSLSKNRQFKFNTALWPLYIIMLSWYNPEKPW